METKSEKRERIKQNQGKMIMRRGIKLVARIQKEKAIKKVTGKQNT